MRSEEGDDPMTVEEMKKKKCLHLVMSLFQKKITTI